MRISATLELLRQPLQVAVGLEGGFSALSGGNDNLLLRHRGHITGSIKTGYFRLAGTVDRHLPQLIKFQEMAHRL